MRPVAVVAFAHSELDGESSWDDVELTQKVCSAVRKQVGLTQSEIGFTVSGSSDFLSGRPFSFVSALDGVGAFPPIQESHVEMDGAFALYEAWVRLQHGDIDTALVYAFGQASLGDLNRVLGLQMDPHWAAPLGLDEEAVAGLQAAARGVSGAVERVPLTDGAAAIILAAGDRALELNAHPAWIRGIEHRIDCGELSQRDLTQLRSAQACARALDLPRYRIEQAELHFNFEQQRELLKASLQLADDVPINSGESSQVDAYMVSGLLRIGEAARAVRRGSVSISLAHASAGPAMQQNLVCVLGAKP
jgi:hypothetical protein